MTDRPTAPNAGCSATDLFLAAPCEAHSTLRDGQYHVRFGSGVQRGVHVADTFDAAVRGAWAKYLASTQRGMPGPDDAQGTFEGILHG